MMLNDQPLDDAEWQTLMTSVGDSLDLLRRAYLHPQETRQHVVSSLRGLTDMRALRTIFLFERPLIVELVEPLVDASISQRAAGFARELLGRLPYAQAAELVPPAVWRRLQQADGESDDEAYQRLAELLNHLGLYDALRELCERAAASPDPNIQAVADDFAPPL